MPIARIPVYVLNALYLAPITLWTYYNYGRPPPPSPKESEGKHGHSQYVSSFKYGSGMSHTDVLSNMAVQKMDMAILVAIKPVIRR